MRLCSILVRVAEKHRECELWFGAGVSSVMSAAAATTRLSPPQSADQAGLLMSISGFELPLLCQSRSFVAKDGPGYLCVNSSGDPKIPLSTTIPT